MAIPNIRESDLILSFFFHGRGTDLQKTPLGLFQSLLYQLLREVPDTLSDLMSTFQQRCKTVGKPGEKWQWHSRELQRFFESALLNTLKTRPLWLFVDALDECGQKNAVRLVREFKSLLQGLPSTGSQFHICFTCRHYPILDQTCQFEICLEDENGRDISTYVRARLSVSRELTASTIPDLITKHAQGVFIWAYLVVDQILDLDNGGAGLKKIEDEIYSIPPDLDDLYHGLIRNVDERAASLKLIQWICFATRPLSLDELRWAMIVDADCQFKSLQKCQSTKDYISDSDRMKRRVQTLSRGLAEVTSDAKVIQFIHQSVKDFFVEKGLSALDESANPDPVVGIAHHRLSRTCIRYLAMEEIGRPASHEPYRLESSFPFLHYATTSWVAHTKQSDARIVPQEDLLEYFAGPSNTLIEQWVRIYRILEKYSCDCPPEGTSLVHVLSRYGVTGLLRAILQRTERAGIDIDCKNTDGQTPLSQAALGGHETVVRLLINHSAAVKEPDKEGRTALWWATWGGSEAVVRLLIGQGADVKESDKEGRTPVSRAAGGGHKAIVQLLVDEGADVKEPDKDRRTPVSWAAGAGHEAIVQLLISRGADIDAADNGGQRPLWWAAMAGHKAIVQLLINRGADIDALDSGGQTMLWQAADKGNEAIVQRLIDYGAAVDTQDNEGRTPLSQAAGAGNKAVARLLLGKGAAIDALDNEGRTPLSQAAGAGNKAVARLLLGGGAHTEAADKRGRTPLSWAAENGHEAVVRLLLEKGAAVDTQDNEGRTPVLQAAWAGNEAVVRLLLEKGAAIDAPDNEGRTPVLQAAWRGHEAVVRLLLEKGAAIDAPDNEGRTPVLQAAWAGNEAVVRLLLEKGAAIDAPDNEGRTPLLQAAWRGHEAVVQLLLEKGAAINAPDKEGRTPLLQAALRGHEAVVRLLQVHAAQPSSTPLS
ncbi:hypothetical protein NW759_015882 [Fusarium solani]|nr:hypothetical protein NW759_015882 [Fusarium solani]